MEGYPGCQTFSRSSAAMEKRKERSAKVLAPVVQNVDKAIRWLNLYVVENAISFPITLIHWIVIYPVDSAIHRLNNRSLVGEREFFFSQLGAFAGSNGKKNTSGTLCAERPNDVLPRLFWVNGWKKAF